ncbi:hypothetical protein SAMN05444521_7362 [Streptomyces sp. 3214.6]|nr:hypothetical protein SAMN05444521_7362 [Streptomyces sp. 3214.6]
MVFGVWMTVGLVFYFLYGHRRSRLPTTAPSATPASSDTPAPSEK